MTPIHTALLGTARQVLATSASFDDRCRALCGALAENLSGYDWVGFYWVSKTHERHLELGPYVGAATDHDLIPFGRGICGQAAETLATFVIDDVRAESNYLACSLNVRSEIVVPILRDGILLGELDIDSHQLAAFSPDDREFCEAIAQLVAQAHP